MRRAKRVVYTAGLMVAGGAVAAPAAQWPPAAHQATDDCFAVRRSTGGKFLSATAPGLAVGRQAGNTVTTGVVYGTPQSPIELKCAMSGARARASLSRTAP
jgi:hypothetical protein